MLGDNHGNVVHLGERECSIQRRHQKLIEESPSPAITPELRREMGEVAVRACREIGYVNAGTMEFLLDEDGNFYFMEMNTRIQVEHPVTEMVTNTDLVREQILIAAGERMEFGQEDIVFSGHAIECRINAESPTTFAPSPGLITAMNLPGGPGVRVDTAVYPGWFVPPHYDSLIAKLIVHHRTREMAIARMQRALRGYHRRRHRDIRASAPEDTGGPGLHCREPFDKVYGPLRRRETFEQGRGPAGRADRIQLGAPLHPMPLIIPRLYPITDVNLSGRSHAEQVALLVSGGATFIQLRDKASGPGEFYRAALEAVKVARRLNARIIINDRVDIALAAKADGVHLGQDDLPPEAVRRVVGPDFLIGYSTHNLEQALRANSAPVDYVAIGPVFQTATKDDPDPVVGLDDLRAIKGVMRKPLVAIGGINLGRARAVIEAGADSLAIISDLYSTGSPAERARQFMRELEN